VRTVQNYYKTRSYGQWPDLRQRRNLQHCEKQSLEVFYVTNRDQGPNTYDYDYDYDYELKQLQHLEIPFADREHSTVLQDSSDRTPAREAISATHELKLL
jgi:hypothetical protein